MIGLISAIISAAVAGATAIGKGVQARKQRRERAAQQDQMAQAMAQASDDTEMNRRKQEEMTMQGLKYQTQQMAPLQGAMETAYGSVGYEAPNMDWVTKYGEAPRADTSDSREVKPKAKKKPAATGQPPKEAHHF